MLLLSIKMKIKIKKELKRKYLTLFLIFSQIIVLVLGVSFFVISIAVTGDNTYHPVWIWTAIPPGFLQGTLVGIWTR